MINSRQLLLKAIIPMLALFVLSAQTSFDGSVTVLEVSAIIAAPACLPDDSSLNAYWKLDDISTTALDSTGNGNDGTYNGTTQNASVPSTITFDDPYSRDFDGVDDFIDFGTTLNPELNTASGFTVSVWVNPDAVGADQQIISKGYDGTNTEWEIKTTTAGGKVSFQSYQSGNIGAESTTTLLNGTWSHVAGTYDGTSWRIYVNGVLEGTTAGAGPITTAQKYLVGAVDNQGTPIQFWDGKIDDVRIMTRVLTDAEVAELAGGTCQDSGALTTPQEFGIHGGRHWKKKMVQRLNNLGNSNYVNAPTAPPSFGGPTYFGENPELTWDQVTGLCELHNNYDDLILFDLVDFMAENFARMFGISEEYALDMITNGAYCETVIEARAEDVRIAEEYIAKIEADRRAERFALLAQYKPEEMLFAVDVDGFPVSSDMIWNACIRNYQVFLDGQDKPINCRRYHEGHTWTHPDTFVTFDWSDRRGARKIAIRERGYVVATQVVDTPIFIALNTSTVRQGIVAKRYVLPMTQYLAQKGTDMLKDMLIAKKETMTVVLSEETTTAE
jgi:hypothetical protein